MTPTPSYLQSYEALWKSDPHAANLEWFRDARFGLFIHYGLYSALGKGEWVQFNKKIPVAEYARLQEGFRAENFDGDFIADLACEAGIKYVNLVTCHHDSFCLWDSKVEPFNSMNAPCGRDLVGEMAAACAKKGLGLFLLLNAGPMPDGSIHPHDIATLRAVGKQIRERGWPEPISQFTPPSVEMDGPSAA